MIFLKILKYKLNIWLFVLIKIGILFYIVVLFFEDFCFFRVCNFFVILCKGLINKFLIYFFDVVIFKYVKINGVFNNLILYSVGEF